MNHSEVTYVLHNEIGLSGQHLHLEDAELIVNLVKLVDDCFDRAIFLLGRERSD